jgi:hypothetical protein
MADLLQKVDWHCARTAQLIAGIVSQLAFYTEEGVVMTPSVFICSSVARLVQLAGVGEYIPLSGTVSLDAAGSKLLKAAAPLCSGNWRIYVERVADGKSCKYGIFCGTSDPSSLTIDEVVLDEYTETFPVVRISQSATNKVEVRTNTGDGIEFRFNNDENVDEIKVHENISALSNEISKDCGPLSELFSRCLDRMLSSAIKSCHGTLIAVVPCAAKFAPQKLADMVALEPPFHLYDRLKRHLEDGKSAESVSRLQVASELVSGFISSDGITVFNSAGYVIGYRSFVNSNSGGKPVVGGARSRAFEAIKAMVGTELTAVFFRSQDGKTGFFRGDTNK